MKLFSSVFFFTRMCLNINLNELFCLVWLLRGIAKCNAFSKTHTQFMNFIYVPQLGLTFRFILPDEHIRLDQTQVMEQCRLATGLQLTVPFFQL